MWKSDSFSVAFFWCSFCKWGNWFRIKKKNNKWHAYKKLGLNVDVWLIIISICYLCLLRDGDCESKLNLVIVDANEWKKQEMTDKKHRILKFPMLYFFTSFFTLWTSPIMIMRSGDTYSHLLFPIARTHAYSNILYVLELFIYWTLMAPWVNAHSNANCIYRI